MAARSTMSGRSDVYLMIGNEGVGKSTLLNGLIGEPRFKSGVSVGSGMTYQLDKYTTQTGVTYADTPGLADTQRRQQAGKAITEALKLGGCFRIFFVVTLAQGRVSPEDVTTMKLVLDAAPITSYGIIINQLSRGEYDMLNEGPPSDPNTPAPSELLLTQLLVGLHPSKRTISMHLMKRDDELDGEVNKVKSLPEDVQLFIQSLPPVVIEPETVQQVRADAFEEERESFAKTLEEVRKKNQRLDKALGMTKEQVAALQRQASEHQKRMEALLEEAREA